MIRDRRTLIEGAVKNIRDGSEIVSRTNEAFSRVAGGAVKAEALIGEIASASQEQAQGIEEISKAISAMDRIVQQNASSAEESASASAQLEAQAENLKALVEELVQMTMSNREAGKEAVSASGELTARRLAQRGTVGKPISLTRPIGARERVPAKPIHSSNRIVSPEQIIPLEDDFREM